MKSVSLTLAYPPSGLMPNRKLDRWTKGKATKQARKDAFNVAMDWRNTGRNCCNLPKPPVRMTITWFPKDGRMGDYDSMHIACKAYVDGITDASIIPDDSPKWIKGVSLAYGLADKKNPRTVITIEEVRA